MKTLVSIHCYAGDRNQIDILRPLYEHHKLPILVISPTDSPVTQYGPHHCRMAGLREYYGQKSWDRQVAQMKVLLEYPEFQWFLMHDSDSVYLDPVLPDYLFEDDNVIYSNLVDDFRKPGETSHGQTWPITYHKNFPNLASQPPYFCSRNVLQKMVDLPWQEACPITPFIDWQLVVLPTLAGVKMLPFRGCASCETVTNNGIKTMSKRVSEGAVAIHAIKTKRAKDIMVKIHKQRNKK